PLESRRKTLEAAVRFHPNHEAIVRAVAAVDPTQPAGEAETAVAGTRLTAHVGDLAGANDAGRVVWRPWVGRGHFTLLTSEPKVGKTRLGLEIAHRVWNADCWPDGQEPTFPPGTKTLWVPGDRNQDELRELARAYGIPEEAVLLNASPDEPYGGVSL